MKKIFTLLFAVGIVSIASAQSRDFGRDKQAYGYAQTNTRNELQKIDREYDFKIAAVKMSRRLNSWEKSKQIRFLENQRDREIIQAKFRFEKSHGKYDDRGFSKNNNHKW